MLITGAGSGIGQALAQLMASLGAKLVLTDINKQGLDKTVDSISSSVLISSVADVSSKEDWQQLGREIENGPGYLDVLVNNAGMSSFGFFDETSEQLFNKVIDINFNGVVHGCREMLPLLEKSERGMIVNIASIFGLISMPLMTPYHASKFAVRGFTEALKQDMIYQNKNIDVVCVMPGGIKTNIAKAAETENMNPGNYIKQFDTLAITSPVRAARVIEKGMRKNKFRVLIGPDARLVNLLYKLLPTYYYKVSNLLMGVKKIIN
jgi:short-subunit dehydrogenase